MWKFGLLFYFFFYKGISYILLYYIMLFPLIGTNPNIESLILVFRELYCNNLILICLFFVLLSMVYFIFLNINILLYRH